VFIKRFAISLFLLIATFFPMLCYAGSDSGFTRVKGPTKRTMFDVSIETLGKMISECMKAPSLLDFLREVHQDLNRMEKRENSLRGCRFYYDFVENKTTDCNMYYRFKKGYQRILRSFPTREHDCTDIMGKAALIFLRAKNSDKAKIEEGKAVQALWQDKYPLVDPLSADMQVLVRTHPELDVVFSRMGFDFVSVPVPVGTYVVEPEDSLSVIAEKYGEFAAWPAISAFNAKIKDPKKLKHGKGIKIPVPFAVPKSTLEDSRCYIVQKGDTLERIANFFYKDSNFWGMLYLLNKDKVAVPTKMPPGIILAVPFKESLSLPSEYSFAKFKQAFRK
jgi:LysM repeat protein